MGTPAAAPVPPTLPAPAPPPSGFTLARWLYVDERRTHEVHAGVRKGNEFVVKESAFGNVDPDEVVETVTTFNEPWEAQTLQFELENRLGMIGNYWRRDNLAGPGWTLVRPQAFASLDLRPVRSDLFGGNALFHHFHKKGYPDVVVVTIPQATPRGPRFLVAELTYTFPNADDGDLGLLHAHLPQGPATSLVAREHLALEGRSYRKQVGPNDFALAHGPAWRAELDHSYRALLTRLAEGRLGVGLVKGERAPVIDSVYTDYLATLTDPRLIALHARFLAPGEEQRLIEGAEPQIHAFIKKKREDAPARDQHLLTILGASLLAKRGLRAGQATRVDPEVAALVRRFAYYL